MRTHIWLLLFLLHFIKLIYAIPYINWSLGETAILIWNKNLRYEWIKKVQSINIDKHEHDINIINPEFIEDNSFKSIQNSIYRIFLNNAYEKWTNSEWYYCINSTNQEWNYCTSDYKFEHLRTLDSTQGVPKTDYLNRGITSSNEGPASVIIAFIVIGSITLCFIAGIPAAFVQLSIAQSQMIQAVNLMNMNIPDDNIGFGKSLRITNLDFRFLNFMGLQDTMEENNRRNLRAGSINLSNVSFSSGSLFTSYIYYFLILTFLIIVHIILFLLKKIFTSKSNPTVNGWIVYLLKMFEFKVYFNLVVYSHFMMFIISLNEIIGGNFDTSLNRFSFIFSLWAFVILLLISVAPILLLRYKSKTKVTDIQAEEIEIKGLIEKIKSTVVYGLKETKASQVYISVYLIRRILVAVVLVIINAKEAQLTLYVFICIWYLWYLGIWRPFKFKIHCFISGDYSYWLNNKTI